MSGGTHSFGKSRHGGEQDFELNLASIIDCFTVLIAFMLVSASFLSIGILDAGVAASGQTTTENTTPPPVNVTIELGQNHAMSVKLSGKSNETTSIGEEKGEWNHERLTAVLSSIKQRWNGVEAVTLTASDTVEYKDVVKTMEIARKTMPAVLLGGF